MMNDQSNEKVHPSDSKYWLSLEQWAKDPSFVEKVETEFQSSPIRENASEEGWARREFLKLMGASLAMATAGCIRRPVQKIVPYSKQPEEVTLGVSNFYTSSFFDGNEALGLLVKSKDGRPIKIEGNPNHPLNQGATSAKAQASILSLYDPERLQTPRRLLQNKTRSNHESVSIDWKKADEAVSNQLKKGSVAILSGPVGSPSLLNLISDFCKAVGGEHYQYSSLDSGVLKQAQKVSYGDEIVPNYRFDQAKVIVSVDADFIGTWMNPTAFAKGFAKGRKDPKTMNQLFSFDSTYTLTSANADLRGRIKPSQQLSVVLSLIDKVAGSYVDSQIKAAIQNRNPLDFATEKVVSQAAESLLKNKGQGLVVAGGLATQTESELSLQVAVNYLNHLLENDGKTVDYKNSLSTQKGSQSQLQALMKNLSEGKVKTLIIHRANPVYNAAGTDFLEALKKAEVVIATNDRIDETAFFADFVLPDHHPLESWGDLEAVKGLFTIQQPLIAPMYSTRDFYSSLVLWAAGAGKTISKEESSYEVVRAYWKDQIFPKMGAGKSFQDFWEQALQEGVVGDLAARGVSRSFKKESLSLIKASASHEFELALYPSVALGDGLYANISWLQELPDPVRKIAWDNFISISLATAEKLKVKEGDHLELKVGDKKVVLPAQIQPGLHDQVAAIPVGYGRTRAGKVANKLGYNAFELIRGSVASGQQVQISKVSGFTRLANPQGSHAMQGRKIVAEATLTEYLKDQAANNHKHHIWSLWPGHNYNGHKWGMMVDLNLCNGCNACVIACQSENNIPVVGKRYMIEGREMHWIRIDRYYVGDPAEAESVFQPVMCQQCDNAPCETVCPVLATVHSSEGLNDMVYNRCVGTRYCSNNCPYKVRRFNWFNYATKVEKPLHLAMNPEVTQRMRGVMEKCTFCTHRIKAGKISAKAEGRTVQDGDIKTACQQVCPTEAIVFGDLNDPNSKVAKVFKEEPRGYALLEEFNAAPSVRYLTKIRNNNQDKRHSDAVHGGAHS